MKTESDPTGREQHSPGAKLDAGKVPVYQGVLQYFPRALMAVAALSAEGANKYAWKGWSEVPDGINRYSNAEARHILKEEIEGEVDLAFLNDPKHPAFIYHKTQAAWNALAALELFLIEKEKA